MNNPLLNLEYGNIIFFTWTNEDKWPVEFVSPSVSHILGFTADEFTSRKISYSDLIHPDDLNLVKQEVSRAIADKVSEFTHQLYRIRNKDNQFLHVHDHTVIIRDKDDQVTHFQGYIYDISELYIQKERFQMVLEGTNLGMWDWNPQTNDVVFDEGWAKMLGYELSEIDFNLESWSSKVHPDDIQQCYQDIQKHLNNENCFYRNIHRMKHKDGHWLHILDRGKVVEHNINGEPIRFTGTHTDISDLKEIELALKQKTAELTQHQQELESIVANRTQQLQQQTLLAEQANKAKSDFIANMSHELRTPLNSIINLSKLVLKGNINQKDRNFIEKITDSGENLLTTINNMLDFSKIESGSIKLKNEVFSLSSILDRIKNSVQLQTINKPVSFIVKQEKQVPELLYGDPFKLNQVLSHLCQNAVKFTLQGHIDLSLRVKNSDSYSGIIDIEFAINDTGVGISDDKHAFIFDSFTQEDSSSTRLFGGAGLGLSICKELVKLMGGSISVKSQKGKGSCFCFNAVFDVVNEQNIDQFIALDEQTESLPPSEPDTETVLSGVINKIKGLKLLLVEDNDINQMIVEEMLNDVNINVDIAENGAVAIEKLHQHKHYDGILMDIQMPVMDGFTATREIRKLEKYKNLPIVALTAIDSASDIEKCLQSGMNAHISKPIEPDHFFKVMAQCFSK